MHEGQLLFDAAKTVCARAARGYMQARSMLSLNQPMPKIPARSSIIRPMALTSSWPSCTNRMTALHACMETTGTYRESIAEFQVDAGLPSASSIPRNRPERMSGYSNVATTLMVSARIPVLKANDSMPCSHARWRIGREVICTSDTWLVMPMTKEK